MDTPPVREIAARDLKAMMDRGEPFQLVDVRSPAERQVARIEGARLLDQALYDELIAMDPETADRFPLPPRRAQPRRRRALPPAGIREPL
jgi:rhodanese-related sulfurtransferase